MIETGITLRGFTVFAYEPNHYRHYHTLFLRLPEEFPTGIREYTWLDRQYWKIAFDRPDGKEQAKYSTLSSREEAEQVYTNTEFGNAKIGYVCCQFEVGYKQTDAQGNYLPLKFCNASYPSAKAWGTTWADTDYDYAPLKFDLTEAEALEVIAWREQADEQWFAAHPSFLPREKEITEAQVAGLSEGAAEFFVDAREAFGDDAVAVVGSLSAEAIECLECGAVYEEPGHVEPGAMGCDRCG